MGFFISFLIFIAVDTFVSSLLVTLGVDIRIVDVIVSLTIAFIFAYMNSRKPVLSNLQFHKNFAFIFIVLLTLRFLFNYGGRF
jgi:type III secretory pathway component EscR